MKRVLLSLIIVLAALTASAQALSYDKVMKLSKMTSVEEINTTLTGWGYKIGRAQKASDKDIYAWGQGAARFDENLKDWKCDGMLWSICTYVRYPNGGGILWTRFPMAMDYNKIKIDVEHNGWKEIEKTTNALGINTAYAKEGTKGNSYLYNTPAPPPATVSYIQDSNLHYSCRP